MATLRREAQDWQEVYGHDEQTPRPCVFVTCTYAPLWASFWLQFDLETRLPVRVKGWVLMNNIWGRQQVDPETVVASSNWPARARRCSMRR